MKNLKSLLIQLVRDEQGSEMLECVLLVALIILIAITPAQVLGQKLARVWTTIERTL